jgi:hypothetical protein
MTKRSLPPMISVPVLDPKTGKPKMSSKNHRTFGQMVGYAEYRHVPKGSDPEAEKWREPRRMEQAAMEFLRGGGL